MNKGTYWVLSRQTFKPGITNVRIPLQYALPWAKEDFSGSNFIILSDLQNEIDNTRFILSSEF
jgi:hypothetical protein